MSSSSRATKDLRCKLKTAKSSRSNTAMILVHVQQINCYPRSMKLKITNLDYH